MKLNFKNIKIENFLSIGNAEINLMDNGYTFVKGINENNSDNAISNGSGKSTIFEAISWVLTGETIRGSSKDIVNIYTDGGALVEINLTVNNDEYKIIRTKDHKEYKTNLKIFINGEDKSGKGIRDTQKLLNEYIPDLTSSLIGSVIILGQGMPQRFSNNTPSGRKEILEKLSKSDFMIEDLKHRVSNRKNELSLNLREVEDNILTIQTKLDIIESSKCKDEELLESLNDSIDYDNIIEEEQNNIEQFKIQYSDKDKLKIDIDSKINNLYEQSRNIYTEKENKLKQLKAQYDPKIQPLNEEFINLGNLHNAAKVELQKLKNIQDICPTCGQKLPNVFKPDTTQQENVVNDLFEKLNRCDKQRKTISEEYTNKCNEQEIICKEKDKEIELNLNKHKQQLNELQIELNTLKNSIEQSNNKLLSLTYKKDNIQKDIQKCEERLAEYTNEINVLNTDLLYNYNIKEDIENRISIVNKFNTVITRDFRGYLLSNVIEFINNKSKEYCKDIFLTDKIEFTLDGNNISISYDGKEYEVLSGGEKQKVDLIIQFAIRDMLCKFLNFSSNILVVDEVFDNLDAIGCQQVINLISTKLADISSVFIVSHHTDIDIPCDKEIIVVKDNSGISKVK